ncbi:hypothetical protein D6764_04950 [Candidatus Woesearchaeota archaeon]|nr:MAG: hypothetical protein D6764_04950 [Candidatus Woesearchaeota archaeon]
MAFNLFNKIAQSIPGLKTKLFQAEMLDEPPEFVKKAFLTALYMSLTLYFIIFLITSKMGLGIAGLLLSYPVALSVFFLYFLKLPDVKILRKEKDINREIVFAGRFLIIEMESGVPIYDTFKNVAKNYETIGKYFREVIDKVNMGTTMEQALNEATEMTPSANLRKIFWQILNSMKTGSDVTKSLNSVLEQITKEQQIQVEEYGRKLNPLAMFYMMIAVIIPSLGMTMFMVLATFLGLKLSLPVLLSITGFLGFIQFMFVAIIKSSRPAVEM